MEAAFPRVAGKYKVVEDTDCEVMQRWIDKCVREKWTDIADLYGCVRKKGKLVPGTCTLPCGYGTIKAKSWKAAVVKGRPISPHVRHPGKRISNTVARGYHVCLTEVDTERVTRMFTTQEFKTRVQADQVRVTQALRAVTGDDSALPGYVYDM